MLALYARKSVERENSISCETQIEYCKMMIRPEERGEKVVTFIDNGFSGGNVNRDGFQKMMRLVRQPPMFIFSPSIFPRILIPLLASANAPE